MELSLEGYFLVNFAVTMALLALALRQVGAVSFRRIAFSSMISACAAMLIQAGYLPRQLAPALLPLSVIAALGGGRRAVWLGGIGWCALGSAAFAGVVSFVQARAPIRGLWHAPMLMAPFFAVLWRLEGSRRTAAPRLRMCVVTARGTVEVSALVDTGNQLREPISALPVLIVGGDSLKPALGPDLPAGDECLPLGFRVVCFRALGGSGRMICFRPLALSYRRRGRWVDAPPMWIGVYPGRIPGGAEALAPDCVSARETGMGGEPG